MANNMDPDQTAPVGAVCSGSTLFASILNSSVMLGNYLQQTTSADDVIRCFFGALRVNILFFLLFVEFFSKQQVFGKSFSCQIVWIKIRSDILSASNWVKVGY